MLDKLFVYGTLMRGYGNHRRFMPPSQAAFVSRASLTGFRMLNIGQFPAIVKSSQGVIHGELYIMRDVYKLMPQLDKLEQHPHMYRRRVVHVTTADGAAVEAWVYVWQQSPAYPPIPSGDYRTVALDEAFSA